MQWTDDERLRDQFPNWPNSVKSSFIARIPAESVPSRTIIFDIRSKNGHQLPKKHQFIFGLDDGEHVAIPDPDLMSHIGAMPPQMFLLTGRTLAHQFNRALRASGPGGFSTKSSIMEWGCGSARIIQHVKRDCTVDARIVGIDVDSGAIEWCRARIPDIEFATCRVDPPTPYPDESFDLIYAFSVLTHLRQDDARAWIAEVYRLLQPGGHFAFTTLGVSSLPWLCPAGNAVLSDSLSEQGIYDGARNDDLDEVLGNQEYYRNTWVSNRHVLTDWACHFNFVAHEPCFHHYQDLWIIRRP
jgi:SAM-dependent methyltransferase